MKLLIVTQVVDTEHPILGFFHRWIEEFAKHCEQVHVICLEAGKHSLPANVTVHSLGKEVGKNKLAILLRFYQLIWSLRKEYDGVFVHMNQIYVILGAPVWRYLRKTIGLWYAHGAVSESLKVAVAFADYVFTSTPEGLRIETPKRVIVGQGIDTAVFTPAAKSPSEMLRLITVGRISPSKNLETLLRACALLRDQGVRFQFQIVGAPITAMEREYQEAMKKLVAELDLQSAVVWVGAVANHQLPSVLQQADIFIHDGATNSLDKALLEASLCGCIVVSSNPAYRSETEAIAPEFLYKPRNIQELVTILKNFQAQSGEIYQKTTQLKPEHFFSKYSVSNLISGIVRKY